MSREVAFYALFIFDHVIFYIDIYFYIILEQCNCSFIKEIVDLRYA